MCLLEKVVGNASDSSGFTGLTGFTPEPKSRKSKIISLITLCISLEMPIPEEFVRLWNEEVTDKKTVRRPEV